MEPVVPAPEGVEQAEADESPTVTELAVELGRDLSRLALCEAQLQASRNMPTVRRVARDVLGALVVTAAFLAAFVFATWPRSTGCRQPSPAGLPHSCSAQSGS